MQVCCWLKIGVTFRKCEVQKFTSRFLLQSRVEGGVLVMRLEGTTPVLISVTCTVGCSVQIMCFAIVHKVFIGVCNLCGKYFSLMDT